MRSIDVKIECANFQHFNFLVCTRNPWLAAISHPKPSIVLRHGLSRLASRKDCKPAVRESKPRLWSLKGTSEPNTTNQGHRRQTDETSCG